MQGRQEVSQQNKTNDRLNGIIVKCVFKNIYLSCPSPVDSSDCKDLAAKISQCQCDGGNCERAGKRGKAGKNEKRQKKEGKGRGKQTTEEPAIPVEP